MEEERIRQIVSSYNRRDPYFKRVVYEFLRHKHYSFTDEDVDTMIESFEINAPTLRKRVGEFLNSIKDNKEARERIVQAYEQRREKLEQAFEEKKQKAQKERLTPPIKYVTSLTGASLDVLKGYRDLFNGLESLMSRDSKGYHEVITEMLSAHILPNSDEGKQMIEENNLDGKLVTAYFDVLDKISIGMSIGENKEEVQRLINGMTDYEYDLIADLESEGLSLDDQEGQRMLHERCVREDVIKKFFNMKKQVVVEKEKKQLEQVFETLNSYEKYCVEDMLSEGLTPDDQEAKRMFAERTVNEEKIRAYFKVRNSLLRARADLNQSVVRSAPANDKGNQVQQGSNNPVSEKPQNKGGIPAPEKPSETKKGSVPAPEKPGETKGGTVPAPEKTGEAKEGPVPAPEKTGETKEGPVPAPSMEEKPADKEWSIDDRLASYCRYLDTQDDEYKRMIREGIQRQAVLNTQRKERFFTRIKRYFSSLFTRKTVRERMAEEHSRSR